MERVAELARQTRAIELRKEGWSYRAIAEEFGVVTSTAFQWIAKAQAEYHARRRKTEATGRLVDQEWHYTEELLASFMPPAVDNQDATAAAVVLRTLERRAKLMGLDKAAPLEDHGKQPMSRSQLRAAILNRMEELGLEVPKLEHGGNGNGRDESAIPRGDARGDSQAAG